MRNIETKCGGLAAACIFVLLPLIWANGAFAGNSCVTCHSESDSALVESVKSSVHASVGCHGCHGGNPAVADEAAMTDAPDFKGKPERKDIPEFCGGCHSDVRRMNPFGLQTDQLAQYRTSKHGERLFGAKDENVAVCADCHGAHGIKSPKDPASTVYPTNIPATCGRCHSDEKKMSKYKIPASYPADYERSVHAHALRIRKDLSAPTCVTCHGNHGATPPGVRQVSEICGRCHVREAGAFEKSPHAGATQNGKMKACVSCHSNHAILHPTDDLLRTACVACHQKPDDKALTVRDEFLTGFGQLRQDVAAVSDELHKASTRGFDVGDAQVRMEESKTALIALTPAQHALDLADLSKVLRENNERMDQIHRSIKEKILSEGVRRLMFLPIAIFLVVLSIAFAAKRAEVEQDDGDK